MLFSSLTDPSGTIVHTIETIAPFVHLALQLCGVRNREGVSFWTEESFSGPL